MSDTKRICPYQGWDRVCSIFVSLTLPFSSQHWIDSGKGKKVSNLKVTLSCWGLTKFQALDLVLHVSYFICIHFCKDMSGFTRDGEGRLRGHMPSKVSRGAWQESGIVLDLTLLDSNLCLDICCGIMGKKWNLCLIFVLIVTVGIY